VAVLPGVASAGGSGLIEKKCDFALAKHYNEKASSFMNHQKWSDGLYAYQAAVDSIAKCAAGTTRPMWIYNTNVSMAVAYYNLRDYKSSLSLLSAADSWISFIDMTRDKKDYESTKKVADNIRGLIADAASRPIAYATTAPTHISINFGGTNYGGTAGGLDETIDQPIGVVTVTRSGCDYFIVDASTGYAVLEWYGGWEPSRGDVIKGTFQDYGFHSIYDKTADASTRVYVEDYWLDRDEAYDKLNDECS
jgi:hypothetical protein